MLHNNNYHTTLTFMDKKNSNKGRVSEIAAPSPTGGRLGWGLPVSKYQPLKHYVWGNGCDGWNLVDEENLSIKQERMPAGTGEQRHFHKEAQQFFYILKGTATFEVGDSLITVSSEQGFHIPPNTKHKISNHTSEDLEFLLCSQPSTKDDRIDCE